MTATQPRTRRATPVSDTDTVSFLRVRPRLAGIARRVLGGTAEADDIVQEAWIRWQQSDRAVVRDPAAFLTTTTTRLALNAGRTARARHEVGQDTPLSDVVDASADPVLGAERGEAVSHALATVLETLSSTERAVYVLREAFDYPHRQIAQVTGLSEANVRQVATRARRHIGGERRGPVDPITHGRLVEAFAAAAGRGELGQLERALTEEVADVPLAA